MSLNFNIRWEGKMAALVLLLMALTGAMGMTKLEQVTKLSAEQTEQKQNLNWDVEKLLPNDYYVSLRLKQKDFSHQSAGYVCGGSLISHNVVLTAAHCFVDRTNLGGSLLDKSYFVVVLGKKQESKVNENALSFELQEVQLQVMNFDMRKYEKDIAVIVLKGTVPPFIQPVQMAKVDSQPLITDCQISAWNSNQQDYFLGHLVNLNVTLIDETNCQMGDLLPGMLCAANANDRILTACTTDGGGPLLCQGELVGISSYGVRCGEPHKSGIYTSVQHYKVWIDELVKRFGPREQRKAPIAEANDTESDSESDESEFDSEGVADSDSVQSKNDLIDVLGNKKLSAGNTFKPYNINLYAIVMLTLCRF